MRRAPLRGRLPEAAAFALFCALYTVLTVFHEPWFDEAQAWQIAKCAPLRDILFELPHYEGHPPLWHLLLSVPAKLGVPFEIGLKTVAGAVAAADAYLLLFRSPLPRPARLVLPFNYFILYQYGVIARPYGLMLLALLLLSEGFPKRDKQPWRCFVLPLLLLCLTSAYGIVLSGGLALCRVRELWREKGTRRFFAELASDRRTRALGALLLLALALLAEILPRADTWVTSANGINPPAMCLLMSLLTFLPECLLTTGSWFRTDLTTLQYADVKLGELVPLVLIGILLWGLLILLSSRRALKWLLVPYLLFAVFAAAVYFGVHHLGVALLLLLFWFNILFRDEDRFEIGRAFAEAIRAGARDRLLLRRAALLLCGACLAAPLYWTAAAAVNEVRYDYGAGRAAAAFLRAHALEDCRILSSWAVSAPGLPDAGDPDESACPRGVAIGNPVLLSAYFDRNMALNLNDGRDDEAYMRYRLITAEEQRAMYARWRAAGPPDLLLSEADLEALYGGALTKDEYAPVLLHEGRFLWKDNARAYTLPLYLRADLLERYALAPVEMRDTAPAFMRGLSITEEMREAVRNGAEASEVLSPYLDALFGEES